MNVKIICKHFIKSFGKEDCCGTDFYTEISTGWKSISLWQKIINLVLIWKFSLVYFSITTKVGAKATINAPPDIFTSESLKPMLLLKPINLPPSVFSTMNCNDNTHHQELRKVCSQLRSEFLLTCQGLLYKERHAHWRKIE